MEEEGEPAMLIFQRVLKHNVLKVLPEVTDASVRLQTIWVLAQFVVNGDLQKVLLGLVLQRLRQTTTEEMIHDDRFAAFQHVAFPIHKQAGSPCFALVILRLHPQGQAQAQ